MRLTDVAPHSHGKRTFAEGVQLRKDIWEAWHSGMQTSDKMEGFCREHSISNTDFLWRYLDEMGLTGIDRAKLDKVLAGDTLSEDEAYFLGIMMADGCIGGGRPTSPTLGMSLELNQKDQETVQWVSDFLGLRRPIRNYSRLQYGKECSYSKVNLADPDLSERLIKWGIVPRKSTHETYHVFSDDRVQGAFVRGEMDGDGCVQHAFARKGPNTGKVTGCGVVFCGGREFIAALQEDLVKRLGLRPSKVFNYPNNNHSKVGWGHAEDILKLYQFMYPDGAATYPSMRRKHQMFLDWFKLAMELPSDPKHRKLYVPENIGTLHEEKVCAVTVGAEIPPFPFGDVKIKPSAPLKAWTGRILGDECGVYVSAHSVREALELVNAAYRKRQGYPEDRIQVCPYNYSEIRNTWKQSWESEAIKAAVPEPTRGVWYGTLAPDGSETITRII